MTLKPADTSALILSLKSICFEAGKVIRDIYQSKTAIIESKADLSPVTSADIAAHTIIVSSLAKLTPDIPVLSEEDSEDVQRQRHTWNTFWCVDPLDGTREFIEGTGEFTVNIALISQGVSILGMIYSPMSDTYYWGEPTNSHVCCAYKQVGRQAVISIQTRVVAKDKPLMVTASRRHGQKQQHIAFSLLSNYFKDVSALVCGSSIKMCKIAEGQADIYPRLHPTCEWDTAAADAILSAAGGAILDANTLRPLKYNQRATLINPSFIALGDKDFPKKLLQQLSQQNQDGNT